MLNRVSSNILLKAVIALMAAGLVLVLALGAWSTSRELAAASRLAAVADVQGRMFRAMANLRLDRALTVRALGLDGSIDPGQRKQIDDARAAGWPALQAASRMLPAIDFAGRETDLPEFDRLVARLGDLYRDTAADMAKPKAERRPALAEDLQSTATAMLALIQRMSGAVEASARGQDAFVDQMMLIKDAAWMAREDGGNMSVTLSNAIAFKKRLSPEGLEQLAELVGHGRGAFAMLETLRVGLGPDSPVVQAIDRAEASFFAPAFVDKRKRIVAMLSSDQPIAMATSEWTLDSVPRLKTVLEVAETALDVAESHARDMVDAARTDLILRLVLLVGAVVIAAGGIVLVSRRVIGPLQAIRAAMLKVAAGDLSTEVPYRGRSDEIGSLAGALATFKQNAEEKAHIEAAETRNREQAVQRQQTIERHIAEFEAGIGEALRALAGAAGEMQETSNILTGTAARTNDQAREAAAASTDASHNVQTVAAASEELSASVEEIGRQVSHAATIAKRAVTEAEETDGTVQGLTEAAHRIGEIVSLITAIANQTNLLALNATIEAARAGEAGKGFAVVASEVKTLAGQTAKATEDISSQVGAIREVADQALAAMRRIGSTIAEVSSVASSIAAAVEQQGAATQEITRNTQEAARRTMTVSDNIAGVTTDADATGAAAEGVKTSAEVLNRQSDTLRHRIDGFLQKIRAA
ncbi:Methyl-accepting chemotaxis protein [Rhodovulum sp. PH10]|uniref:methyl-accepting chemotaxis protein n=1 Tax=Rhodovulum sp. PH10 TaxID=1187851 RepID=UPI00027C26DB|nr:methyl-accepting chemotaxis protein [Rhodovulum sp. PH10]EJW10155.1 Methyl-accepting chemotaxis protein [Rhodovulum sp. PH10]